MTYIYLITNCFNSPNSVYIGKTKNPTSRKNSHCKTYGKDIIYTIIDQVNSYDKNDWTPLESFWLEQFRQWGFFIVNKNKKGGGGSDNWPEKSKIKMSLRYVGRKAPWATGRPKGTKYTEEQKQKMRKPRVNRWEREKSVSPSIVEEIRTKFNLGHKRSDLSREYNVSWGTIKNITDHINSYK